MSGSADSTSAAHYTPAPLLLPSTIHAPSTPPPHPPDVYRYKHAHLRQWTFAAAIRKLWQPLKRMLDYFLCCSYKCKNVASDYSLSAASCFLQRQNFCSCRSAALELSEQRLQQMYVAAFHVAASKVNVSSNCALECEIVHLQLQMRSLHQHDSAVASHELWQRLQRINIYLPCCNCNRNKFLLQAALSQLRWCVCRYKYAFCSSRSLQSQVLNCDNDCNG